MDFIKHNLIFVIIMFVCVISLGGMLFLCTSANGTLQTEMEKMEKTQQYLKKFASKKIKMDENGGNNNQKIARDWAAKAVAKKDAFDKELQERFHLPLHEPPKNDDEGYLAKRMLEREIEVLNRKLRKNKIEIEETLTFSKQLSRTDGFSKDEKEKIFRKLELVKKIVDVIISARNSKSEEAIRVDSIKFPLDLEFHKEQFYTITPVDIVFTASASDGQTLVNKFSTAGGMLFFIRDISIKSSTELTEVGTEVKNNADKAANANAERNNKEGEPAQNNEPSPAAETQAAKPEDDDLVGDYPPYRSAQVVYDAKQSTTWTLRIDCMEIVPEKNEAEAAENTNPEGAPDAQ